MKKWFENLKNRGDGLLLAVDAVCVAILGVMAGMWLWSHPDTTPQGKVAAIASAVLFAVLGVRFLRVWTEDWSARQSEPAPRTVREKIRPGVLIRIFLACMGVSFASLLLVYIVQLIQGSRDSFRRCLELWTQLDTQHYLAIAEDWYHADGDMSRVLQLVFLPGYPLLVRLFKLFFREYLHGALAASGLCFSGAGVLLYLLVREDHDHETALRTLKYACILPGSVFFAAPMSESLFLLLSLGCVLLARREKWLPACVLGGMAAFTRSLGLTLAVPVCYELIAGTLDRREKGWDRKAIRNRVLAFACLLLIPLGFGCYCGVSWSVTGDPFRFLVYQREHWNQSMGLFFNTAAYQTDYMMDYLRAGELGKVMGLSMPNLFCTLGYLPLLALAARRQRPSYTAYFIAYFVIAVGATWLLSGPRYLAAAFPVPLALAVLTKDRRADDLATVALTALYVLYDFALVLRWQVW